MLYYNVKGGRGATGGCGGIYTCTVTAGGILGLLTTLYYLYTGIAYVKQDLYG